MRIDLPQNVNFIIDTLYEHGFEAYAVGGCVRDSLLGRTPQDWDITTSAKPAQVKAIFDHTIDTGIQHGTVIWILVYLYLMVIIGVRKFVRSPRCLLCSCLPEIRPWILLWQSTWVGTTL